MAFALTSSYLSAISKHEVDSTRSRRRRVISILLTLRSLTTSFRSIKHSSFWVCAYPQPHFNPRIPSPSTDKWSVAGTSCAFRTWLSSGLQNIGEEVRTHVCRWVCLVRRGWRGGWRCLNEVSAGSEDQDHDHSGGSGVSEK